MDKWKAVATCGIWFAVAVSAFVSDHVTDIATCALIATAFVCC